VSHDPADHCLFHAWLLRLNFLESLGRMARASTIPGLGVFAPFADDAPARLDRSQGAFKSLLRVVHLGRGGEKLRLGHFDWKALQ
jgi:hypothetical protein